MTKAPTSPDPASPEEPERAANHGSGAGALWMDDCDSHIALYRRYRLALAALPLSDRFMPYAWSPLPNSLDSQWMPYSEMFLEFSRELANVINDFTLYVRKLRAWSEVVPGLSYEEKFEVCREFVDPLAIVAAGLPFAIKERFAFAIAHLCHQADRGRQRKVWRDNLIWDGGIKMDVAKRLGRGWASFEKLEDRLDKVNDAAFTDATHNFRNAYNHRLSPRFVIGMTRAVQRHVDRTTKAVYYEYGGIEALDLTKVSALLAEQRDRCYDVYEAFQALVSEHAAEIAQTNWGQKFERQDGVASPQDKTTAWDRPRTR